MNRLRTRIRPSANIVLGCATHVIWTVSASHLLVRAASNGRAKSAISPPAGLPEAGTVLAMDLHGRDESILRTLFARVMHVTLQNDGSWLLGCAFANPLSEEDLTALRK